MNSCSPSSIDGYLRRLPLFSDLEPEFVALIASKTLPVRLAKRESLNLVDDAPHGFYVLLQGSIKLGFISAEGGEKVLGIVRPMQSFGEELMFPEARQRVCAQALKAAQLLYIPSEPILEVLRQSQILRERLFSTFAKKICWVMSEIGDSALLTGRQRVIKFLLREAQYHQQETSSATFKLPVVQAVIASLLDLTPEHFCRVLRDLNEEGIVHVQRSRVHIPCVKTLTADVPLSEMCQP